jgi:hypothetical protein
MNTIAAGFVAAGGHYTAIAGTAYKHRLPDETGIDLPFYGNKKRIEIDMYNVAVH